MLGVFLDCGSLSNGDIDFSRLEKSLPTWQFFETSTADNIRQRTAQATVVVSNKIMLDADCIAQAQQLRLILISATGTNNVDLEAAQRHGIAVCNVTGYSTPSVVQHVFMLILALTTRLLEYQRAIAQQRWQKSAHFCLLDFPISEIAGKTLGIVGYGTLGQQVAHIAKAFGMRVLIAQRAGSANSDDRLPLAELLPQVDILTLHCPLTAATRRLIGAKELALMKPTALLINTARGGIVDETALANALCSHQLGGAGVDVLSVEPPDNDNPLLAENVPNLILTPHIAWASREARQRLVAELVLNLEAFFAGALRNQVV